MFLIFTFYGVQNQRGQVESRQLHGGASGGHQELSFSQLGPVRAAEHVAVDKATQLSRLVYQVCFAFFCSVLFTVFLYIYVNSTTSNVLEKNVRSLIENVDELASETNKYLNYHKQLQKQNHLKQQHLQKRVG